MEKDYENFVQRMGSFEMDLDDMFSDNEVLKHYAQDKFLVHHGVKGMKWGVRKDRPISKRKQASKARFESGNSTRRESPCGGSLYPKRKVARRGGKAC